MSKLYAKVKSEKAEKGQGGNSFIEIELRSGTAKQSEIEHVILFTAKGLWINGKRHGLAKCLQYGCGNPPEPDSEYCHLH